MRKLIAAFTLALSLLATPAFATITLVGVASTPADNGSNNAEPTIVTPPMGGQSGDLVVVFLSSSSNGISWTVSEASEQTWNSTSANGLTASGQMLWCVFNGTWGANNPSFEPSGTGAATTAVMFVIRPTASNYTWSVDNAIAYTTQSAVDTYTITGVTRSGASSIAIAWFIAEGTTAATWGSLSGDGWSDTGLGAQYRNTSGTDMSSAFAYNIGTGATGNVAKTQGSTTHAGVSAILSFKETAPAASSPSPTFNLGFF